MNTRSTLLSALLLVGPTLANAATPEDLIRPIQEQWAEIKYRQPADKQAESYDKLATEAHRLVESNPGVPEALIWEGIVLSSEAGAKGGLGALGLAKDARRRFEEALKLNDKALGGSAYTSLATLYAKVPVWPIGFGDKERADEYFRKSLALNPTGVDPNFLYGEYLAERGRVAEARAHLEAALRAPPRSGRELADSGRRQEAQALLLTLKRDAG